MWTRTEPILSSLLSAGIVLRIEGAVVDVGHEWRDTVAFNAGIGN